MLSSKNLSPRQLSAFTAFLLSVPIALGLYIFGHNWLVSVISLFVIFIGSFSLILFALQTFIYRKIKLIYKLIYQTKASKQEDFYYKNILPQKSIDEVREDVEKWAEQKKQEIEVLKRNETFRREFIQNLSHELKTPIFAIQGYVDTLIDGAMHNEEVNKKFLQSTSRNVERLASLIGDLDKISKLETGLHELKWQVFIVQDLIKEVFESLYITGKDKNISFQIKKGCEFPLQVHADKEKIRQLLINLIQNAVKYGKESGILEASIYNVDEKTILVEISDNGFGISEEHLPRIFERFYRTDLARSRKAGGSGLGLSICKHIVEAHGQTIHARSKINVGSTFGFTLAAGKS